MLVYICLSSHGYGHASRQAAIISELSRLRPELKIVISCDINKEFLNLIFKGVNIIYRRALWDIGVRQSNALSINRLETRKALRVLSKNIYKTIDNESAWIKSQNEDKVLIIGDIPPSAAILSEKLKVPLIWIANFGWDDIYRALGDEYSEYTKYAQTCYAKGNLLVRLPFSLEMKWNVPEVSVGLTYSKPKAMPEGFIHKIRWNEKPIVMVAFGGMGYQLKIELFKRWSNHIFILNSNQNEIMLSNREDNVFYLPKSSRTLDVLPYCNRLIGKPGYSTFCEAISNDVGLHIVDRKDFIEADALITGIMLMGRYRLISQSALHNGDWELDKPLLTSKNACYEPDGALESAKIILNFLADC